VWSFSSNPTFFLANRYAAHGDSYLIARLNQWQFSGGAMLAFWLLYPMIC
jgi:hypothetical protein